MGKVDFKLDDVELRGNVAEFGPKVNKYLTLTTDFAGGKGVDEMKLKAPWTDRTTNARSGLNSHVDHSGSGPIGFTRHTITFAHAVTYGIWLEIKNSGKFQIIMPVVVEMGKAVMKTLGEMFDDLDNAAPNLRASVDLPYVSQGTSQGVGRTTTGKALGGRRTPRASSGNTTRRTRRT